ncbi:MAG: branched-chain amino acid ABC transporter permease [Aurantimonas coralicida]|uniref:branched-chain amino acid ABC transporter permease n=1 Tax=Aurantimonas coralicida TaxID=182270 RepID=UPI00041410E2|nr:branched-chain amino acid ABC transporter permease [Aurantimonas coralicida]MAY27707.1 branched-chain amino acid ABC transporter permease [Aurantimonas sp.]MCC4299154.1 branched-chain amino acid ABC transporter permease [Aurantimonas coralicida]MDE0923746.1 branched-chain amino acid ABC transporter permease [Aurantimonas coralicida]
MATLFLDILTTSSMLFIVAAGLMIILGVMKLINFAHGAFLTVGGYAAHVVTDAGFSPWLTIPAAAIVGFLLGVVVERLIVRPLYSRPLDAILATWGLGIVIAQVIVFIFGREVQFAASPISGTTDILATTYSSWRLILVAVAVIIGGLLTALLYLTRFGLHARAVIMNENLARGLGIDSVRVRAMTFGLGAALACAAGALITPLLSVDPNMGLPWLVNSFMLVLVSGVAIPGLALASLFLGGAQVLVSTFVSPILGGITIVVLAAVILRIKPQGLSRG